MTDNEADVLAELATPSNGDTWQRPMDFGGGNGSHHAVTAKRMAHPSKGWVEWRYRGHEVGKPLRNAERGSCLYRITEKGRQALANHNLTKGIKA